MELQMKLIKVLIFLVLLVVAWIVAPAEAFVLGSATVPGGMDHSSSSSFQQHTNLFFESEALSNAGGSFNPYLQSPPRSFSNIPRYFKSNAKHFSRGSGHYRSATGYDTYTSPDTTPTQTPEPATLLLFGAGLAGVGIYRRMKN